jgi:HNH endonuclease
LSKGNIKKLFFVHVLILTTFEGPCPAGLQARHRDGVRTNARLSNLHYGTAQQNIDDREAHGRTRRGEQHGMAILNAVQVREIRAAKRGGISPLSVRYGVSRHTIDAIRCGRLWKHIQ